MNVLVYVDRFSIMHQVTLVVTRGSDAVDLKLKWRNDADPEPFLSCPTMLDS